MTNDMETILYKDNNIDPVRISQWAVDSMMEKTSPYIQSLMYSKNLQPEQLECIYKTRLYITKTYSDVRNIAEIYGADDAISSLKLASYNIEHFLKASIKQIRKMFEGQNIDIQFEYLNGSKSVYLDIRRTSLILFNLISNSIIHTKVKDKVIKISTFQRGDDFVISVKDNGQGIDRSMRKTLFEVDYKKLSSAMIAKTSGGLILTGMGLAVARKSATDMNGTLNYLPSNSGTIFELAIPQHIHNLSFGETIDYEPKQSEYEMYFANALLYLDNNGDKP